MRSKIYNLVDENGVQLVNENGDELIASISLTDYLLSAQVSPLTLHGYSGKWTRQEAAKFYLLVDESGNYLTDENGVLLGGRLLVSSNLFYAESSRMILHGG